MKFYKKNGEVYAFKDDGSQDDLITDYFILMSIDEIDKHCNPEKYLTDDEKLQLIRDRMPTLSPIEFDIKLNKNGLYDIVQELIKDNFELRIAYTRAIFFSRTDPFIEQARIALGLSNKQIDEMWIEP